MTDNIFKQQRRNASAKATTESALGKLGRKQCNSGYTSTKRETRSVVIRSWQFDTRREL